MTRAFISPKINEEGTSFSPSTFVATVKIIIGSLLLIFLISPEIASAQQQPTFYCVSYYKIVPGKEQDLQKVMENVDIKVQQERVNGGAISAWHLYKVLSPSGSNAEYDYVIITVVNRNKNIFETPYSFDSAFKKTFHGKEAKYFEDYYSRLIGLWKPVKEEIYVGLGLADSSSTTAFPSKYVVVDFMQPKPEKFGEYIKMEIDTFRVIHKERTKLGDISQWACFQLLLPFNMKTGYSFLALNFYNDLDHMMSSKYVEALKSTFPQADLNNLFRSSSSLRDNPKADMMRLLLYAAR